MALKQAVKPYAQQGQEDGDGTADFRYYAQDEADKGSDANFPCQPGIFAGEEFSDCGTEQREIGRAHV